MKNLETQRLILRIPKLEDAEESYQKWASQESIAEYSEYRAYQNMGECKILLRSIIKEAEEGMPFWFIQEKQSNNLIGYIKISEISYKNKTCNLVFYFQPFWRKENIPEEALQKALTYLFEENKLQTVEIRFYDKDKEDTEVLENIMNHIGMKKDGVLRSRKINGKGECKDLIIYSMLRDEYESIKKKNKRTKIYENSF